MATHCSPFRKRQRVFDGIFDPRNPQYIDLDFQLGGCAATTYFPLDYGEPVYYAGDHPANVPTTANDNITKAPLWIQFPDFFDVADG